MGNIPSSLNIPFTSVINEDKTFKTVDELKKVFIDAGIENPESQQIILSCQRGITACVLESALRIIGNPNVTLYDGSYEEYSRRQAADNPPAKLQVEVEAEIEGKLCPKGARVLVHYTGRLNDGTKFDSSLDRGKPLDFIVGVGQVIRGWDEGIVQLKKGQKATITCPPEYAYGARGVPGVIPPNATLIFEVELVDFIRQTQ